MYCNRVVDRFTSGLLIINVLRLTVQLYLISFIVVTSLVQV